MAVLTVLSIPVTEDTPDSAPWRVVSEFPSIEIELIQCEREGATAVPYFWMHGVPTAEFESVLTNDPQISAVQQLDQTDEGALFKAKWAVDSPIIQCVAHTNGVVIQAHGTAEEWRLKIWFEDGSDTSAFQQCCTDQNIPLNVDRLTSLADILSEDRLNVSQQQYEALVLAYREGYFDTPRRVSQEELADKLGISSSAVGHRLRRGFSNLVEEMLIN